MGVQPPCDFFFNRMGLYFQRLNIAGSLTNVVFNKTTARYRQQPRLPLAIWPIDQGPVEIIFNKRHMALIDFSSLFIEFLAFQSCSLLLRN